jgi:hypothetical protein
MSDKLTIEKQNEIIITWLLHHAGYFSRDEEKKKKKKEEMVQMSPVDCLRLVHKKVNQEATT